MDTEVAKKAKKTGRFTGALQGREVPLRNKNHKEKRKDGGSKQEKKKKRKKKTVLGGARGEAGRA